ncbi:hypothetical protein C8R43DRAFT_942868 [Mycena crocata]|nr:hypothetical protein C8R43DRAFT_942868 [Mycena crocata]
MIIVRVSTVPLSIPIRDVVWSKWRFLALITISATPSRATGVTHIAIALRFHIPDIGRLPPSLKYLRDMNHPYTGAAGYIYANKYPYSLKSCRENPVWSKANSSHSQPHYSQKEERRRRRDSQRPLLPLRLPIAHPYSQRQDAWYDDDSVVETPVHQLKGSPSTLRPRRGVTAKVETPTRRSPFVSWEARPFDERERERGRLARAWGRKIQTCKESAASVETILGRTLKFRYPLGADIAAFTIIPQSRFCWSGQFGTDNRYVTYDPVLHFVHRLAARLAQMNILTLSDKLVRSTYHAVTAILVSVRHRSRFLITTCVSRVSNPSIELVIAGVERHPPSVFDPKMRLRASTEEHRNLFLVGVGIILTFCFSRTSDELSAETLQATEITRKKLLFSQFFVDQFFVEPNRTSGLKSTSLEVIASAGGSGWLSESRHLTPLSYALTKYPTKTGKNARKTIHTSYQQKPAHAPDFLTFNPKGNSGLPSISMIGIAEPIWAMTTQDE